MQTLMNLQDAEMFKYNPLPTSRPAKDRPNWIYIHLLTLNMQRFTGSRGLLNMNKVKGRVGRKEGLFFETIFAD